MFDDDVFDRVDADYLVISVDGILVPFFMEEYRFRSEETALVKFEGIDTQEQARELTNCEVFFERRLSDTSDRPSAAAIIGYHLVSDEDGKEIGTITAIDDTTDNVMLELQDGRLIPAAEEFVKSIDNGKRIIRVDLPEGLLDL